jgi:hypothetical protein
MHFGSIEAYTFGFRLAPQGSWMIGWTDRVMRNRGVPSVQILNERFVMNLMVERMATEGC